MKKLLLLLLILLAGFSFTMAQTDGDDDKNEKISAMKIAFITDKLSLSSKEAEGFWPVFNRFEQEMKSLRKKERELARQFKAKAQPTEAEADRYIQDQTQLKQQEVDLLKKYIPEFKKVLPAPKVARLLSLEQEFKVQLLRELKQRHGRGNAPQR